MRGRRHDGRVAGVAEHPARGTGSATVLVGDGADLQQRRLPRAVPRQCPGAGPGARADADRGRGRPLDRG